MNKNKRLWIIGGSSGIGFELVKILLDNDYRLIVSSRSATSNESLLKLQSQFKNSLQLLNIDVNQESFQEEIEHAWSIYNGIDIWFYNAATYEAMSIDEWNKEKFTAMNQTNYMGAVNIMTEIISYFEKQGFGRWIWNLSLSAYFGLPKGGAYSAPKAALLNLAQAIQPELKTKNIDLQIINHGFVKTRLTAKNKFDMPQLMTPEFAAQKIFEGIQQNRGFEIAFPFKLGTFLKTLACFPYKLSLAITKKML